MQEALSLCRAWIYAKLPIQKRKGKGRKKTSKLCIHVCGKFTHWPGLFHQCYCGAKWKNTKRIMCEYWVDDGTAKKINAKPSADLPDSDILNLYGTRRIDLDD